MGTRHAFRTELSGFGRVVLPRPRRYPQLAADALGASPVGTAGQPTAHSHAPHGSTDDDARGSVNQETPSTGPVNPGNDRWSESRQIQLSQIE